MPKPKTILHGRKRKTLAEVAKDLGLAKSTFRDRWIKAGRPKRLVPGAEFSPPPGTPGYGAVKRVSLHVDGEPMTIKAAAEMLQVSHRRITDRIRCLGPELTAEQIQTRKKQESTAGPRDHSMDGPRVRPEELERLARIPGPTKWELELWGMR